MAKRKRSQSDVPALPFDDRLAADNSPTGNPAPSIPSVAKIARLFLEHPTLMRFCENLRFPPQLPSDFSVSIEAQHLSDHLANKPRIPPIHFLRFILAGVREWYSRLRRQDHPGSEAMKVARHKLFGKKLPAEAAQTLSPVSKEELMALEQLSHPNVVRLYNILSDGPTVFAICTTFIADPANLDYYLRATLEKTPKRGGMQAYSPERLETACGFLLQRCRRNCIGLGAHAQPEHLSL